MHDNKAKLRRLVPVAVFPGPGGRGSAAAILRAMRGSYTRPAHFPDPTAARSEATRPGAARKPSPRNEVPVLRAYHRGSRHRPRRIKWSEARELYMASVLLFARQTGDPPSSFLTAGISATAPEYRRQHVGGESVHERVLKDSVTSAILGNAQWRR